MARIFTLHGTNDTGPAHGEQWWQKGGALEYDLMAWVEAEDGKLEFEPIMWSGENSETERFEAGSDVADRLNQIEKAEEPYCVVAHSHGASVLGHAFAQMVKSRSPIAHMRQWISVAAPFIEMKRKSFLLSRVSIAGVAALLILAFLGTVWAAFAISSVHLLIGPGLKNPAFDIMILAVSASFLFALYTGIKKFQPRKLKAMTSRVQRRLRHKVAPKWFGLWHEDDEVLNAGRVLKDINFKPFKNNFATSVLALASFLLVPIVLVFMSSGEQYLQLTDHIDDWISDFEPAQNCDTLPENASIADQQSCADPFKNFARESLVVVAWPAILIFGSLSSLGITPDSLPDAGLAVVGSTLAVGAAVGFIAIWLLAVLWHRLILISSWALSFLASKLLNHLTNSQLIRLGFGDDSKGESAVTARAFPEWSGFAYPSLPQALSEDITTASDTAAAEAISKIRMALTDLSFVSATGSPEEIANRYVTWRELVHTNYFNVERLRRLIAYAITQQEGFRATEEFSNDSEYRTVAAWYDELVACRRG